MKISIKRWERGKREGSAQHYLGGGLSFAQSPSLFLSPVFLPLLQPGCLPHLSLSLSACPLPLSCILSFSFPLSFLMSWHFSINCQICPWTCINFVTLCFIYFFTFTFVFCLWFSAVVRPVLVTLFLWVHLFIFPPKKTEKKSNSIFKYIVGNTRLFVHNF